MAQELKRSWVLLGTGGTIAGRAGRQDDHTGYKAGEVSAQELLADLPGVPTPPLAVEQIAQIDSKDMGQEVWRKLLARTAYWLQQPEVQGVLITHGTDTLEETAFFLQQALGASGLLTKPVVLTCAMRPATALTPDGPQNLVDSMAVLLADDARGVLVVCAGTVHGATEVQKVHGYRVDAFSSGEAGPLGFVEAGSVRWVRAPGVLAHAPASLGWQRIASAAVWPRVEILFSHADAHGGLVDLLLKERAERLAAGASGAVAGLVAAGTGNGTLHQDLEAALRRAVQAGVAVLRVSRCALGRVLPAGVDALPSVAGLNPYKARVALMLQLLGQAAG